ncbi:aminotransferase class III-fold pyridoxal phosphate-dependent enzyme [Streptomyces gamaensis]|uniref:Diaminobutyrate--2-oxoglutarate transaminase n=1 Tax=Streptomyces gamaensis TaxID=1763542 RepID=A0ABW0Z6V9_9ACTN
MTHTRQQAGVRAGGPGVVAGHGPAPVTRSAAGAVPRRRQAGEGAAHGEALPVVPVRARGLTVEGADGRRYLDCFAAAGALALGHNHPVVLEAMRSVLDSGAPLHVPDLATPVRDAFARELLATLPGELAGSARIRFCGPARADALQAAARLVRAATGREGLPAVDGPWDAARGSTGVRPAGVLVEPVPGEGAVLPVPAARMRRLREAAAAGAVPLVADETRTGVGRTGALWAVGHSGTVPDVMVLSGAVGGGLPLACLVHRSGLDAGCDSPGVFPYQGNQLAMAAGAATLRHVRRNRLAERARELGARMLTRLRGLAGEHTQIAGVSGLGLMLAVEFAEPCPAGVREPVSGGGGAGAYGACCRAGPGGTCRSGGGEGPARTPGAPGALRTPRAAETPHAPVAQPAPGAAPAAPAPDPGRAAARRHAPGTAALVQQECLRRGLIVGLGRRHCEAVRLLPPLTITDEQAEAVLDRLCDAVAAAARTRRTTSTPGTPKEAGAASPAPTP